MGWPVSTRATDFLVTAAVWNADLVGNMNAAPHPVASKSGDTARSSTTTLADDPDLLFAMAANEVWYARFVLWVYDASNGVANFKAHFTAPASATWSLIARGYSAGGSTTTEHRFSNGGDINQDFGCDTNGRTFEIAGLIANSSTAGNFTLQWAQQVSNASAVTVKASSFVWAAKRA